MKTEGVVKMYKVVFVLTPVQFLCLVILKFSRLYRSSVSQINLCTYSSQMVGWEFIYNINSQPIYVYKKCSGIVLEIPTLKPSFTSLFHQTQNALSQITLLNKLSTIAKMQNEQKVYKKKKKEVERRDKQKHCRSYLTQKNERCFSLFLRIVLINRL